MKSASAEALWRPSGKPFVCDISHNNPDPIDFHALAADGVKLVIHKATQGTVFVDPCYAGRRRAALDAGLSFDAYHFCDNSSIDRQLAHFLAVSMPDETMRLALDCEPNHGSTISFAAADIFAGRLDDKRGTQCLRYTGAGFLTALAVRLTPTFRHGPIWWAKYGPMPTGEKLAKLGIDPARIVLWQETPTGQRAGVTGPVDESWWLGSESEIMAYPALPAGYPT